MALENDSWVMSERWTGRWTNVTLENWVEGAEELNSLESQTTPSKRAPCLPCGD